jgi:hypothetical protein
MNKVLIINGSPRLSDKEHYPWKEGVWPSRERKARSHSLYKIALALISNISQ